MALAAAPAGASHDGPLLGQWHLDEKVTVIGDVTVDSSGHAGQDAGAATITIATGGRWGSHLADTNETVLNAGSSANLAPAEITLVAWVRHLGAPGDLRYIVSKGSDSPPECEGLSYGLFSDVTTSTPIGFVIQTMPSGAAYFSPKGPAAVWDGNWHMVAGTFNGDAVQLYVDGVAAGGATSAPGAVIKYDWDIQDFSIDGAPNQTCVPGTFPGGIDEVRVYDRALTGSEVAQLAAPSATPPVLGVGDVTAPQTTITAGPKDGATLAGEKADFQFASSEPGSTFQCRVWNPDTQSPPAFGPCTSPYTAPDPTKPDIAELKTFEVRATDAGGNVDSSPARRTYSTDNRLAGGNVPKKLKCDEVKIVSAQGRLVHNGCRIAPVENGKVRCVHGLKMKVKDCRFTTKSGAFVTDATGKRWALVGQPISKSGKKGGKYLTASPIEDKNRVPCGDVPQSVLRAVHGKDAAGNYSGADLGGACAAEKYLVGYNYSGPLQNIATRPVCSNDAVHPETRAYGVTIQTVTVPGTPPGATCWIGKGAGLNDPAGHDRDKNGYYLTGGVRCHQTVVGSGQYATGVVVAKRPRTYGYPPVIDPNSPIVWRPYAAGVSIAN